MNVNGVLIIGFCFAVGIGLYYMLRHNLNWPSKNNPLFFLAIFAPSFMIVFSPFANHIFGHAVFAFSAGLFLADSVYHRHQEKKTLKKENDKRKKDILKNKQKKNNTKNAQ